ncbi:MAG: response regulator, partial [Desulfobacteraceae bacterium]
ILDAGAVHIMDYLLVSDTFSYMASNYLTKDTPAHVLEAYVTLLEKRKLKSTVKKYQAFIQEQAQRQMPGIAVVSTEKTVLKIYARIISSLGCRPLLFTSPQEAFESVLQNKPQLLITDLFLNDMTGVTFAAEIREMYTQEDLTILISSLQKDLVKAMDKTPEYFELIDGIYGFPIQPSQLKSFVRG